ncbi:all trans-polyprenyl-diphosphate synthase PDSS2-like [Oppia nitens]|uniref:all trans-polyprenyl-diphosphate synthase PDSS2-like n=1 Tax=Oppia nitens TaxID=1686743 RepID=UPI0023DA5E5B|nr:all trans-polyprenyl-diphosphate synthase PDSS2-like [Oppia nitens]
MFIILRNVLLKANKNKMIFSAITSRHLKKTVEMVTKRSTTSLVSLTDRVIADTYESRNPEDDYSHNFDNIWPNLIGFIKSNKWTEDKRLTNLLYLPLMGKCNHYLNCEKRWIHISNTSYLIRGLIISLLAKAYSYPKHIIDKLELLSNELQLIDKWQQIVAQSTDMTHVAQILHASARKPSTITTGDHTKEIQLVRYMLLFGDLLLTQANKDVTLIRNPTITGLTAKSLQNFTEAEFLRLELKHKSDITLETLETYCSLYGGSLLGHSCQSVILLAQFDQQIQNNAYELGKHIGIALQLSDLLYIYTNIGEDNSTNINNNDNISIFDLTLMKTLLKSNVNKAINLINNLDKSDASDALINILLSVEKS